MKKVLILFMVIVVGVGIFIFVQTGKNKTDSPNKEYKNEDSPTIDEGAETIPDPIAEKVESMTLEEKIGQLFIAGIDGTSVDDTVKTKIKEYDLGGVILFANNMDDPDQSVQLLNDLKEIQSEQDIPLFLSVDQEGGRVTRLPGITEMKSAESIGLLDDPQIAFSYGQAIAQQLRAFGFQLNFAPVMDINSNPDNPVIGDRAFGNDSETVTDMGIATMKGMQEENVIAAIKHFPGHGDTKVDSHVELPIINKTKSELADNELLPFKAAIDEGAEMVLLAHIIVSDLDPDLPATLSKEVVDILRDDWEYDGVVITDDLTMGAIIDNYGMDEAVVKAIEAGVDILLIAHGDEELKQGFNGLKEKVETGEIKESRIDQSVTRILRLKEKYDINNELNENVSVEELNKQMNDIFGE